MHQLPAEIQKEFGSGNFVVKRAELKFNQVDPDQSREWLPYFLDWNARVLLVSSELLAGVVFEGAFYSRARSIPFSLSVTKFFSKHKKP